MSIDSKTVEARLPQDAFSAIDDHFDAVLGNEPPWLADVAQANAAAGLPDIAITAQQGAFLKLLAGLVAARRICEVGTLGGYSTLWMASGMAPDGRCLTIERDAHHAEVARANFAKSGYADRIELLEGNAPDLLEKVTDSFDLFFIDADKRSNPAYLEHAVRLTRPGGLIVVDNVVRGGRILDPDCTDAHTGGARKVLKLAAEMDRLEPVGLQFVGAKGWDGMFLARVTAER